MPRFCFTHHTLSSCKNLFHQSIRLLVPVSVCALSLRDVQGNDEARRALLEGGVGSEADSQDEVQERKTPSYPRCIGKREGRRKTQEEEEEEGERKKKREARHVLVYSLLLRSLFGNLFSEMSTAHEIQYSICVAFLFVVSGEIEGLKFSMWNEFVLFHVVVSARSPRRSERRFQMMSSQVLARHRVVPCEK